MSRPHDMCRSLSSWLHDLLLTCLSSCATEAAAFCRCHMCSDRIENGARINELEWRSRWSYLPLCRLKLVQSSLAWNFAFARCIIAEPASFLSLIYTTTGPCILWTSSSKALPHCYALNCYNHDVQARERTRRNCPTLSRVRLPLLVIPAPWII
jgi:hypothetical protein